MHVVRAAFVFIVFSCVLCFSRSAIAEDIPKIELSAAGPDKPIPLGKQSFYLTGRADDDVTAMYAVFVRYRYGAWGITRNDPRNGPASCAEVISALPAEKANLIELAKPGVRSVENVWKEGPNDDEVFSTQRKHRQHTSPDTVYKFLTHPTRPSLLYVPTGWVKAQQEGDAKKKWSILVGAEESYFRPGARYCLIVIEQSSKNLDIDSLDGALVDFADTVNVTCEAEGDDPAKEKCREEAANLLLNKLLKETTGSARNYDVGEKRISRVGEAISDDLLGYYEKLPQDSQALLQWFSAWNDAFVPLPLTGYQSRPRVGVTDFDGGVSLDLGNPSTPAAPFAKLILELLATQDTVRIVDREVTKGDGTKSTVRDYILPARNPSKGQQPHPSVHGELVIDSVVLRFEDGESKEIKVSGPSTANASVRVTDTIPVDLSSLKYPAGGSSSVSLEDILQFGGGRIHDGTNYVALSTLKADEFEINVKKPSKAKTNLARLEKLHASFEALSTVLGRAGKARGPGLHTGLDRHLADWLSSSGLRPCRDLAHNNVGTIQMETCTSAGEVAWPGFPVGNEDPFSAVDELLERLTKRTQAWLAERDETEKRVKVVVASFVGGGFDLGVDLDQKGFFDAYVTTSAGVAFLPGEPGHLNTTYISIQAHFYPNLVDEPMWINGVGDFRRLVGLEMGLRPSGKPFGPEDRYGTWPNSQMPALFSGIVLQPIPYITVGGGAVVFGYRSSTLTSEQPAFRVAPYVCVSAQVNLVNLVRRLAGLDPVPTASVNN